MPLIRRKRKHRFLHSPRFSNIFRRNTQAATSKGNRVELFEHGAAFLPALLQACGDAKGFLHLEFYMIRDDAIGSAFAETLLNAVKRGVEVCLIYDYIGCFDTPASYFGRLEEGGVRCLPFNPPPFRRGIAWFDKRDHRKMAVIDGKSAFVGGINIGSEYAGCGESLAKWRDLGMRIDGPGATELEKLFRSNWHEENRSISSVWDEEPDPVAPMGDAELLIVNGGPHHNRSWIRSAFRLAIAGASDSVRIINPYFVPGPRVLRSLLRAAARGVAVQLILPAKSDVPIVGLVGRSYYTPLLKGGIEIFEREGTVLHAKVMLIDDSWAVVGSANLDQRSFHRNYEVNVIVNSQEFGGQVAEMFSEDLKRSRRILIEEHERRGWLVRLLEWLCAPISWFL
ncbi:MAG TPA: phospholipase D-like domain-containing protein [Geobacteraceae bacterium]|nr:phospholipase D-like domain-containing protein [Geobacteraceae bacterium]